MFETILFALPAGLSSDQAALIVGVDGTSFNILATQRELQDDPRIQKLYELLISPEAARFKQDAWGEPVLPVPDCSRCSSGCSLSGSARGAVLV